MKPETSSIAILEPGTSLPALTAGIVAAYVAHNPIPHADLPKLITSVHSTITGLGNGATAAAPEKPKPAVSIGRSIQPDHIVCLHDGRKLKMLKRYLRTHYKQTPEEYRKAFGLPADYPMVAPNYSVVRSAFAKKIGLGTSATSSKKKVRK